MTGPISESLIVDRSAVVMTDAECEALAFLMPLSADYPGITAWFSEKVVPGLRAGTRELVRLPAFERIFERYRFAESWRQRGLYVSDRTELGFNQTIMQDRRPSAIDEPSPI